LWVREIGEGWAACKISSEYALRGSQGRHGHTGWQYYAAGYAPAAEGGSRLIRLQGSCASAGEYRQAIDLISSGKIRVTPLITAIAPLSAGALWFERPESASTTRLSES
jgi:threonine dehydrogenase-like Zn-dependent dehydrogenase